MKIMKAKTYGKDAKKFDPNKTYYASIKYDGNLIQIHQEGDKTRWFTSNGKEFELGITMPSGKYILLAEFMYGCEGKLGDRGKSAILTTLRTNFAKGIANTIDLDKVNIKVFDYVSDEPFTVRLSHMNRLVPHLKVDQLIMTGQQALDYAKEVANQGWEGIMLRDPDGKYEPGKRVHHTIKVKFRKTADLLCIDVEEGEGKCNGIGALVLQDKEGRIVKVGSGLDYDNSTRQDADAYIGKIIEIEYEQILDTYIQPVFKYVREDKNESD